MIYALDTNIISYFLKGDKKIRDKFREITLNKDSIIINPLAYYEIKRGFYLNTAPTKEKVFDQMCVNYPVGHINEKCLDCAGKLYADLRAFNPNDADMLIAAFCMINGYVLVTNNVKHFDKINGLIYENWMI